ncbi:hypothetical protein F5144DRAFT_591255 [Chaetomium tenue]|uniref:Uncharacterized protein n=1 Tax=Chaetomium tenue TaxID=1854479 RepID=A0ACB7PA39_9PEZI|nr:hypothetical protein F5144DRAFT_591255 [Chaetomium globosum]
MDVEMENQADTQDVPPMPPSPKTERPLSPLFTPEGSEDGEDSDEKVRELETECTKCNKTVSKWLDLIMREEGEPRSKIAQMSEEERDLARKPYCLECADAEVWLWLLVNDVKGNIKPLTPAQVRGMTIMNLWETFGLCQGIHEWMVIADYYKFCRGCGNPHVLVETPGQLCPPCSTKEKCFTCSRTRRADIYFVPGDGPKKCNICYHNPMRRIATFQSDGPAEAPLAPTSDDLDAMYNESVAFELEAAHNESAVPDSDAAEKESAVSDEDED